MLKDPLEALGLNHVPESGWYIVSLGIFLLLPADFAAAVQLNFTTLVSVIISHSVLHLYTRTVSTEFRISATDRIQHTVLFTYCKSTSTCNINLLTL